MTLSKGQEGYRFTLQQPSYVAVMSYADDASLREQIYRAYNARAATGQYDNRGLVAEILKLRREKAESAAKEHLKKMPAWAARG